MNLARAERICPDCGAYLSERNPGPRCWPCAEKKLLESITPPTEPFKPAPLKFRPPITLEKGCCSNCGRPGLALHKRKDGIELCSTCKIATYGLIGESRDRALMEAREKLQGKGRLRPGPEKRK